MGILGAASRSSSSSLAFEPRSRKVALVAIALAFFVLAHESQPTQCVPMEKQILPQEYGDVAELGFGDWWEKIKSQVGDALEKAEKKAKEILEGIEVVGEDAWEKIKEAAKGLEVTKEKFVESTLPKILDILRSASKSGGAALEQSA